MLENYAVDHNGVIKQLKKKVFIYDDTYAKHYQDLGVLNDNMSHLRLGFLLGAIGKNISSLLDVGYGDGNFLKLASKKIKSVYGYDVEPSFPLPQNIKKVSSMFDRRYDVVCFFDSLEHMEDIYDITRKIQTQYVLISVPNCQKGEDDEWFKHWKHRKPDEHLWHFNLEALNNFFAELGYQNIIESNIEDAIRTSTASFPNIITAIFKKNDKKDCI